jgi:hypothetical protein
MLPALAVGSALISAYGQWRAGEAQQDAAEQQYRLDSLRAEELLERNQINNELLMESALVHTGTQKAQIAASGVSLGGATSKAIIAKTMETAARQIKLNNRAADWEAEMARLGADSQLKSAGQLATANKIGLAGSLGASLTNYYTSSGNLSDKGNTRP